jgi:glycosyltransferase involved in cell wall biosynthesis
VKICFWTPQLPYPPEQGAAMRNYNLILRAAHRHDVTLVSIGDPDKEVPQALSRVCADVIVGRARTRLRTRRLAEQVGVLPDLCLRLRAPSLLAAIPRLTERGPWDVVQIEGLEMVPAARRLPARRYILDEHNAEYQLQWSACRSDAAAGKWAGALYSLAQTWKLRRYEARACQWVNGVAAVSQEDAQALRRIAPVAQIAVVPNGVDTSLYRPVSAEDQTEEEPATLLFAGKMDFRPNVDAVLWFAQDVLPHIWRRHPTVRFIVFGMHPTPDVCGLARDPRIAVTGYVPGTDAERRYLRQATVCVVPLRAGSGTRLKMLTAMAMGKALVTTPLGASGLDVIDGEHAIIAGDAPAFAEAVHRLLDDAVLRKNLGATSRDLAVRSYDWSVVAQRMEALYAS